MSTFGYVLATLLLLALCLNTADAVLKCWRCSTDVSNGEFCNDRFDPEYISDQQRYWSYVNCTNSIGAKSINARPVCKKLVQEVYGKRVITRACFYEEIGDPADKCARDTTSSYIKTIFCQTCTSDGCNSAGGVAPYAALVLVSAIVLKFFAK